LVFFDTYKVAGVSLTPVGVLVQGWPTQE